MSAGESPRSLRDRCVVSSMSVRLNGRLPSGVAVSGVSGGPGVASGSRAGGSDPLAPLRASTAFLAPGRGIPVTQAADVGQLDPGLAQRGRGAPVCLHEVHEADDVAAVVPGAARRVAVEDLLVEVDGE